MTLDMKILKKIGDIYGEKPWMKKEETKVKEGQGDNSKPLPK